MKEHVKYVHIFWINETRFSYSLVSVINNTPTVFQKKEHLFVTLFEKTFKALSSFDNVELYKSDKKRSAEVINAYGSRCDWIILHGICNRFEILKIRPKYVSKIIWRTWGGCMLAKVNPSKNRVRHLIKKKLVKLIITRVNRFAAVGIANVVDEMELSGNGITKPPRYLIPYMQKEKYDILCRVRNTKTKCEGGVVNILVGHSGYYEDHHIQVLEELEKYKNEAIRIFLVLAYGDPSYIKDLKEYVHRRWNEKVVIIEEYKNFEDYTMFINSIDVAVLDTPVSIALGTISILLFLQKKIYLNSDGVLFKAFRNLSIPCETVNSISRCSFSEFKIPIIYSTDSWQALSIKTYEYSLKCWEQFLKDFY